MCDIRTKPNDICYISLFRVTVPPGPRRLSGKRNIRYVHCQVSVFIVCIQKVELYKGWMVYESHYPLFLLFLKVSDEHDFNACLCWCFDEFLALSNYCAHCHWICNFCVWACFCLFDFVLELIGFVFRFEDLCCDYVQHNVLCNESEFSGVCVIQTVGSLVTRQGLNCFLCVSIPENNFWHFVYTNARLSCSLHKYLFVYIFSFGTSHPGSNDNTFLCCSLMFIY